MIKIQKAEESDLESLRLCAISAFIDDERYKPDNAKPGGPPGHDTIQSHLNWLRNHDYFKCVFYDKIAGGCIVKNHPDFHELFGIFLSRNYIGKGIGARLLRGVMQMYPIASAWVLETPDYSTRNRGFYERNGFVLNKMIESDPNLGHGFVEYKRSANQPVDGSPGILAILLKFVQNRKISVNRSMHWRPCQERGSRGRSI